MPFVEQLHGCAGDLADDLEILAGKIGEITHLGEDVRRRDNFAESGD